MISGRVKADFDVLGYIWKLSSLAFAYEGLEANGAQ
jgi:hypothetical protein